MILNNQGKELKVHLCVRVDGFDYVLFVLSVAMFQLGGCCGHVIKMCPLQTDTVAATEEPGQDGGALCGSGERC